MFQPGPLGSSSFTLRITTSLLKYTIHTQCLSKCLAVKVMSQVQTVLTPKPTALNPLPGYRCSRKRNNGLKSRIHHVGSFTCQNQVVSNSSTYIRYCGLERERGNLTLALFSLTRAIIEFSLTSSKALHFLCYFVGCN